MMMCDDDVMMCDDDVCFLLLFILYDDVVISLYFQIKLKCFYLI